MMMMMMMMMHFQQHYFNRSKWQNDCELRIKRKTFKALFQDFIGGTEECQNSLSRYYAE